MASSTTTHPLQKRDALITRFLPLADMLARRFYFRFRGLLERDDLIQVARLALVQAAVRVNDEGTAESYLRRCINGGLSHHLRDRSLLVRLPVRERATAPWRHVSLDAPVRERGTSADHSNDSGLCWLDLLPAPDTGATLDTASGSETGAAPAAAQIHQLLKQLQPRQAKALRLTLIQGHSVREAARLLGTSAATVCRIRQQAIKQLRNAVNTCADLAA